MNALRVSERGEEEDDRARGADRARSGSAPFSRPRRRSQSPIAPPNSTPTIAPPPTPSRRRFASAWSIPYCSRHELRAEGLDAGEEVVAARGRADQEDVRPDAEHVARGLRQSRRRPQVAAGHELRVGLDAALAREQLRVGLARLVSASGGSGCVACARTPRPPRAGSAQPQDEPAEDERREREDDERARATRAPRCRRSPRSRSRRRAARPRGRSRRSGRAPTPRTSRR